MKVDKLCQLASNLLERGTRQQTSSPDSTTPIVINRIRTGNRYHVYHRRHRRNHPQAEVAMPSSKLPPPIITPATRTSSRTNITEPSVPSSPPLSRRDYSGESLVNLYHLFQDNMSSSRTPIV